MNYKLRLQQILSEMPLVGYNADKPQVDPDIKGNPGGFQNVNVRALKQPKVLRTLSQKLSRSKYNIIIIADSDYFDYFDYRQHDDDIETLKSSQENEGLNPNYLSDLFELSQLYVPDEYFSELGIDPSLREDSITMIMTFDNAIAQHNMTPWMILHQIGEIANYAGAEDLWDLVYEKYSEHLDRTPEVNVTTDKGRKNVEAYGLEATRARSSSLSGGKPNYSHAAFTHIFKMRSAREFIHGGTDNFDTGPELVTEYLWHGKLRHKYPNWIEKEIVDAIVKDCTDIIEGRLDAMVGKAFTNSIDL